MQIDYGKVIIMLAVIGALVALALADVLDGQFVGGTITTILGVVIGNGKTVAMKQTPGPVLSAKPAPNEGTTTDA